MKRGAPPRSQRKADAARAKRDRVRAEFRTEMERRAAPTAATSSRRSPVEKRIDRRHHEQLGERGVGIGVAGMVGILELAHGGPAAPLRVGSLAQAKARRVVAPSWLAVVRMMPCSLCGVGRPFYEQLQLERSQSEANHHPPKRAGGGGSDLETHPVCSTCHRHVTEHDPAAKYAPGTCHLAVALTLHQVVTAIREGRLPLALLVAAGVEAVIAN